MKLEILSCLWFVCEIANFEIHKEYNVLKNNYLKALGYWYYKNQNKPYVANRRQNAVSTRLDKPMSISADRLITMDMKQTANATPPTEKAKMRASETEKRRNRASDKEPKKTNTADKVLSSGMLDPYSLRSQLQYILDETKSSMNASLEVIGSTAEFNEILLIKMSALNCKPKNQKERNRDEDDDYARRKNIKYDENVAKKLIFIVHNLNPIGADNLGYLKHIKSFMTMLQIYVDELNRFDIFLIPIANPDGFTVNLPYWYKNVSPQKGGYGVNLDHNFDVAWKATDENTQSQFYQGPMPFSEPETRAIRDIFVRYNHNMIAYMNIHASSYGSQIYKGDAILYPKGYSESSTNDDKYVDLRGDIDEALRNASLHLYSIAVDTMHGWYGKVLGKSVDYASSIYGIPYALEICMQAYDNGDKGYSNIVLNEIWTRIFKVIFNNIEKSLHKEEHMRRFDLLDN